MPVSLRNLKRCLHRGIHTFRIACRLLGTHDIMKRRKSCQTILYGERKARKDFNKKQGTCFQTHKTKANKQGGGGIEARRGDFLFQNIDNHCTDGNENGDSRENHMMCLRIQDSLLHTSATHADYTGKWFNFPNNPSRWVWQ